MVLALPANPWTPDQLKFQAWLALPTDAREPKTQKQLAALLELHPVTLTDWKRLPGFADAVYALAMEYVKHDLVPVLHAQVKQAKNGSLPHAQWLFEVAGKWTPTSRQQHSNAPGESFEVVIQPRPGQEALSPFLPPDDDG